MIHPVFVAGVCLLLGACGTADAFVDENPSVVLHELDATPGCYRFPDNALNTKFDALYADLKISWHLQLANLFLNPVRADPTADTWSQRFDDCSIEGRSLARGDGWGALFLVMLSEHRSQSAEVHYDPDSTVVDFTDIRLVQTDNWIRVGDILIGCNPHSGWSFLEMADDIACWDAHGVPTYDPQLGDTSPEAEEMQMSADLQCRTIAAQVDL